MMKLSIVLFCLIALCASVSEVNCKYYIKEYDSILINAFRSSSSPSPSPSPNVDCSTVIFDMIDCLSFVSNGSNVTKPEGECCSGLKTVLKTDAECLCEVFKNSADLGIVLDVKKALSLPSACGVSDSSTPDCGLNGAPGSAPAPDSPIPVPPIPVTPAPAPEGLSPAPAPSHSSASTILISFVSMLVSLVVASFSCF